MLDGKVKELTKRFKITKHQVVVKVKGSALAGKRYVPLFDYFAEVPFSRPFAVSFLECGSMMTTFCACL